MEATIVGFGKLGKALSTRLFEVGKLKAIVSNHYRKEDESLNIFSRNVTITTSIKELPKLSEITFITTSDSKIDDVVKEICSEFGSSVKGKFFVHCSGIHSDDILSPLEELGGNTASAHPLQTFYNYSPGIFNNIFWIVQSKHFDKIKEVLKSIGGRAIQVYFSDEIRSVYHSSAVVASNFLNALLLFAKKLIAQTNLSPKFLIPLVEQTIKNNIENFDDPDFTPLTGPIIRSDFSTLEKHLNALGSIPEFREIYAQMCLAAASIALNNGNITKVDFNRILNIIGLNKKEDI
jgi:predicted short-subunit dehydrogenase-like oxidoreductase (DUF2520 family)